MDNPNSEAPGPFEVTISRLISKSRDILSEEAVLPRELHAQISMALDVLKNMQYVPPTSTSGLCPDDEVLSCAREVEDIMDVFLLEALTRQKSWWGRQAATLHRVVQLALLRIRVLASQTKAQILVQKVEKLSQNFRKIQGIELPLDKFQEQSKGNSSTDGQGWPAILSDELAIIGRADTADRFRGTLYDLDQLQLRVISVVGDKGIGKTALVRNVYNRLDIRNHFKYQAWICNFKAPSLESVLVELMKQLPVKALKDLELQGADTLGELLHKSLMELRYLIVLDNVNSTDVLYNLLYFLPDSRNGSRVVVTCREVIHVPLHQEPWGFHLLVEPLDDENSRKLLLEPRYLHNNGLIEKILGKCNGSPSEILLFRGLTATFPMTWLDEPMDVRFLSYMCLPSWVIPCLLYLCLFPKESEIWTRRIFQLWHAEGLVGWDDHSTAEACFQELANRNLIQVVRRRETDNSVKTCRLSGHLHEFFSKLAIQSRLPHVLPDDIPVVPGLAQHSGEVACLHLQDATMASHFQSYISFNTNKTGMLSREVELLLMPRVANQDRTLLRVLDLEGVYKPKLPKQFGKLLWNLRYLGLRWTMLESLPESVSKLSRLETLDLKHTNVAKLPSSILSSKYLQHLYLNQVSLDECKPTESCLSNIQTLWGISMGLKSLFRTVLGKLKGLRKLGLTCYAQDIPEVTESISTLNKLESLRLRSRDLFGQPSYLKLSAHMKELVSVKKLYLLGGLDENSLKCLPKNVRVLTLSMSEMGLPMGLNPMVHLGKLQQLVILRLIANSYDEKAMVCGKGAFPELRVLKLWKLEKLMMLGIPEGTMRVLEELEMRDCKKLMRIESLKHATKLKQITLTRVNEDFAKEVESTCQNSETIVTCRELTVSSPEIKEEADKLKLEDYLGGLGR